MLTRRHAMYVTLGLILVIAAQLLMTWHEPVIQHFLFSDKLNALLDLGVANPENTILAAVLLAVAGLIFVHGTLPIPASSASLPSRIISTVHHVPPWLRFAPLVVAVPLVALIVQRGTPDGYTPVLPWVWFVLLALLTLAAYLSDRHTGAPLSPELDTRDFTLIVTLLTFGLVVGTYELGGIPRSLWGDEFAFWEAAKSIANGTNRPAIFGIGVYTYPILSSYYQGWILQVFGVSLWSWRFSSVLVDVVAIVPTYLLARELFDRRVAALAGTLMIVLPYFLAFERSGFNNSQSLLPVVLALYLLYTGLQRASVLYATLGGTAAGMGFYTYTAGRLGLLVGGMFLVLLFIARLLARLSERQAHATRTSTLRITVLIGAVFVGTSIITALPCLVYGNADSPEKMLYKTIESFFANAFYARQYFPDNELFRDYPPIQIGKQALFYRPDIYAFLLARGLIRSLLVFHHGELIHEHYIVGPLAGPITVIFYFVGLVFSVSHFRRANCALVVVWFSVGLPMLSILNTFPPRHQHMVPIIPALSILSALGIVVVLDVLRVLLPKQLTPVIVSAVSVMLVGTIITAGLWNYFVDVQAAYPPPDTANVISFAALDLRAPCQFVYVYNASQKKALVPWVLLHMPTEATYQGISRDDIATGRYTINANGCYEIFFEPQNTDIVNQFIERTTDRQVKPNTYFDKQRNIITLSYAFECQLQKCYPQ